MKIVGCFLEYDNKFIILLRHSHKPSGNTWGLPAGKVEPDEEDIDSVLREVREETSYTADKTQLELLGNFDFGIENNKYTFGAYRVRLATPLDIKIEKAAHSDYKWVTAEECYNLKNLIPDFHKLLKLVGYIK